MMLMTPRTKRAIKIGTFPKVEKVFTPGYRISAVDVRLLLTLLDPPTAATREYRSRLGGQGEVEEFALLSSTLPTSFSIPRGQNPRLASREMCGLGCLFSLPNPTCTSQR